MFKSGDRLVIDLKYLECEGLRRLLRKFNSRRKRKKLSTIDPYKDVFLSVIASKTNFYAKNHNLKFEDWTLHLYLEKDYPNMKDLFLFENLKISKVLNIPAWFLKPASKKIFT